MTDLWQQTTAFAFTADRERKIKRTVAARRAMLPPVRRLSAPEILLGSSLAAHNLLRDGDDPEVEQRKIDISGLRFHVPSWVLPHEDKVFAFVSAVVFTMYHKCGGADAVLVLDGWPPVAVLNPCSLAPLLDQPFAEMVSDVILKHTTTTELDASRKTAANQLSPNVALGGAAILFQRTIERVGLDVFAQAFDILFVVEYDGSKHNVCNLDIYFNAEVYRDASATNWLQMIQTLLATEELNTKTVRELTVIDEEMTNRLLVQWQPSQFDVSEYTMTAPELFQRSYRQLAESPESLCVLDSRNGKQFTFAEVDHLSDQVAAYLQTVVCHDQIDRFGNDAACALHMPRCAEWYIWMLGILKAGGAYLSLDPDFPANRLSYILEDSGAVCLITLGSMKGSLEYGGPVVAMDEVMSEVEAIDLAATPYRPLATPESPMYMIYTSGSTGKPKGVLVEHRNLVNFVISERRLFKLENRHRIIQGFSTSFDASLEEIWLAFASGSTIICVEKAVMQDSDRLQELITTTGATVLSTVPTLLATMDAKRLSKLELVIVGGEACNKEVIEAYATGGKRMFVNSYGPTEATVACCAAFCTAGEPVTIGRAQPGYVAYIVDESMTLTPPGVPGELCIGGPSVTRGYVNRPELTREKFIHCPFHETYTRMYRTGDLCRWNTDGNIEFLGRIDSQVKLRGFRIEIGEIETNLATFPGVTTAVVVLRNDPGGMPYLCAYLVCEPGLSQEFSEAAFRKHLKASLPSYMIPSRFVAITVIPRSPAGKLDRNGFAPPGPPKEEPKDDAVEKKAPSTEVEIMLHQVWCRHLPGQTIGVLDNFFEIGGHSLLAGKVSSDIRKRGYDGFSIRYLYGHPTIEALARTIESVKTLRKSEPVCTLLPAREEPSGFRRTAFMVVHVLVMHAVFVLLSMFVVLFLWVYQQFQAQLHALPLVPRSLAEGLALSLAFIAVLYGYTFVFLPLIKWIVIGKFKSGTHSIWSWYFLRWWALRALTQIAPLYFFSGTPWATLYLWLMGMRVGRGVLYFPGGAYDFDLIEIGDDSSIGHESVLAASEVVDSMLILRPIRIGHTSSIGVRSCVKGGAIVGDECKLLHLSLLHENMVMHDGEIWSGSPAQLVGRSPALGSLVTATVESGVTGDGESANVAASLNADAPADERQPLLRRESSTRPPPKAPVRTSGGCAIRLSAAATAGLMLFQIILLIFVQLLLLTPVNAVFVAVWIHMTKLSGADMAYFLLKCIGAAPVAVALVIVYTHFWIVLFRWVVLPWHVKPGSYPVTSAMFHRKIMFDVLMRFSLTAAHPLYASIYVQFLLRLLGADVGKRVECSNLYGFTPGLTKFGNETFVADFVGVNPPEFFRGVMTLGTVEIRDRAFVGNGAVLAAGRVLHERSLLGLLSQVGKDVEEGATYIGSPAFSIPRQAQNSAANAGKSTYSASCELVIARCLWEFFRTVTPMSCFLIALFGAFTFCTAFVADVFTVTGFLKFVSVLVWINCLTSFVMIWVIKWVVVGKEKPSQYPLWSSGVWRAEFVVDCTTVIGGTSFLNLIRGTPLMPWFFRSLGATVGSDCYIDTLFLTEPDMVTMGDRCCIGDRVTVQTHLFEDRIMKIDTLTIGDRVSVGALSIVLYNTTIERGCTIGPLSLVMKGESYPAGTHWEGVPAQRRAVPSVMAVAPASIKVPASVKLPPASTQQRETRPSSVRPQTAVDVAPLRTWLLDDGLQDGLQ